MKKSFIYFFSAALLVAGLSSCEGCVKKTTKKATKIGLSAVEGVAEALDEKGEVLAEKTTDAAGKVVAGMGKSIEKQLDEHANKVASVTGKTLVQAVDGLAEGLASELETYYDKVPNTTDLASGVALNYIARYKAKPIIDASFVISNEGTYKAKFECYDQQDKLFLTKETDIISQKSIDNQTNSTLVSFALNDAEEKGFDNIKNVKITVSKE